MLVARDVLNGLYQDIMAGREVQYPVGLTPPEGAVYRSSELCWKVPMGYFCKHGMTLLREAFERMGEKEMLWNERTEGIDRQYVILMIARWSVLREGPLPLEQMG
ncbi:MAG: hypothetical protein E4G90_00675 [Gemmatimonadales bacterium]|nr:MAG: hypothetical protein E4G90_00675 [Gemmatimonadales bacterium]